MSRRRLGRTGIEIPLLGFGSAPLGDLYDILDDETAIATISAAIDAGMTLIDTSPLYGHGLAEHRVGTAVRRAGRDRVVLSTKVGRVLTPASGRWDREGYAGGLPFAATFDYSYDGAMRSLEQSLLRLGVARVDIALVHDLDRRTHGAGLDDRFDEATAGAMKALLRLREDGTVKAIGVGVNETETCVRATEACDIDVVLLAGRYTLLEQGAAEVFLPLAARRGIGVMLGGVFNSGILATGAVAGGRYDYAPAPQPVRDKVGAIAAVAARHGVPLAAAALQFAAAHPAVSTLVVGAVRPEEINRNIDGLNVPIRPDFWADLRRSGLLSPAAATPVASP